MLLRTASFALLLVACAPGQYATMCEEASGTEAQVSCLEEAAEAARTDVDTREDEALRDVRTADGEREVRDLAERARGAIDRITDETRDRLEREARDEARSRDLRDGLRDVEREVDAADRDLREVTDRDSDREPERDGEAERDGERDGESDRDGTSDRRE